LAAVWGADQGVGRGQAEEGERGRGMGMAEGSGLEEVESRSGGTG